MFTGSHTFGRGFQPCARLKPLRPVAPWARALCLLAFCVGLSCKAPPAPIFDNPNDPINIIPIDIPFVLIPSGEFDMGSTNGDSDELPVHRVQISNAFYMGKYEVTQAQWRAVMESDPSFFTGDNRPVEQVSWDDCQEFISQLNARAGGNAYRLPTEAEWEYACRAGTTGDYAGNLDAMAWYNNNSGGETHPVGQKQANAWGL